MTKKFLSALFIILAFCMMLTSCSAPKTCSHEFGEWETVREVSCAHTGLEKRVCGLCGKQENNEIPALPHTEVVLDKGFSPTCINPGQEDRTKCSVCGEIIKDRKNIPALGHDNKITTVINPDLCTGGLEEHKCRRCGNSTKVTGKVLSGEESGLPVLYVEGDITGISKTKTKSVSVKYVSKDKEFESYATLKVQGNSSTKYDKKNFSMKLYKDKENTDKNKVDMGWGKEWKYCLKANYVDFSHLRNIVSCRIFDQIAATRKDLDPNLKKLPTNATVDGFPIVVYINGNFHGLYTFNIPKDKWMYGMKDDEKKRQAVICAENWSEYTKLEVRANPARGDWEIEHCSTANTDWVFKSFNNLIDFINENDGAAFRNGIGKYLDVNATIDTMLYTIVLNGIDNTAKNINYITYDGVKWKPTMYDLDATWGLWWDGTKLVDQGMLINLNGDFENHWRYNELWKKMFKNFAPEIKARYRELRGSILTYENIMNEFYKMDDEIPEMVRISERKLWAPPSNDMDYMVQISSFVYTQLLLMDTAMEKY